MRISRGSAKSAGQERAWVGGAIVALGLVACGQTSSQDGGTGNDGQAGSQGMPDGGTPDGELASDAQADAPDDVVTTDDAAPCSSGGSFVGARITLLSDTQFVNAVRDVFGVTLGGAVTGRPVPDGMFAYHESDAVNAQVVNGFITAADQVAHQLKPCGASPVNATCMESYLRQTLPRAWRRPITNDEIAGVMALFNAGLAISADRAVEVAMEATLTSGSFLYRTELGAAPPAVPGPITLLSHELASALSFALTQSVPDQELDQKAQDGTLEQPAVLGAEVDRLLATDGGRASLQKEVSYLLDLERVPFVVKDSSLFPEFTVAVRNELYLSGQRFLDDLIANGHFSDLFTSHRVYVNADLANIYGVSGVTGTELVAVDLPGDVRGAGILTQPSFLVATNQHAATDDIVHRGLAIYGSLACGDAPALGPTNEAELFATLSGTEHEKALQRDGLAACGACHHMFDPFGLVSEAYDPIGRYRPTDPDHPGTVIDTSATIQGLGADLDGPVNGLGDLANRFAKGHRAASCAALHLLMMTVDHASAPTGAACEVQRVQDTFAASGSFPQLLKSIVTSPAFRTRDWEGR